MQYAVLFSELGHTGHSDWLLPREKRHQCEDAHASKREGAGALKGALYGAVFHDVMSVA